MRIWGFIAWLAIHSTVFSAPLSSAETKLVKDKLKPYHCALSAYIYKPSDAKVNPLNLCFQTHTETRGIYQASACVGVHIEPDADFVSAFYGKKGHWGTEGACSQQNLTSLFSKTDEINQTVNPISSLQFKRHEGFEVIVLDDEFGLADQFMKISDPKNNPKVESIIAQDKTKKAIEKKSSEAPANREKAKKAPANLNPSKKKAAKTP